MQNSVYMLKLYYEEKVLKFVSFKVFTLELLNSRNS